jgi:hypothetical protein
MIKFPCLFISWFKLEGGMGMLGWEYVFVCGRGSTGVLCAHRMTRRCCLGKILQSSTKNYLDGVSEVIVQARSNGALNLISVCCTIRIKPGPIDGIRRTWVWNSQNDRKAKTEGQKSYSALRAEFAASIKSQIKIYEFVLLFAAHCPLTEVILLCI